MQAPAQRAAAPAAPAGCGGACVGARRGAARRCAGAFRAAPRVRASASPAVSSGRGAEPPAAAGSRLGEGLRSDFPILHQEVSGRPLIYLDSAATSQKPLLVLSKLDDYYRGYNSNVHRGVHTLAARATSEYEAAREKVARFIGAASPTEVVFTRGATEAINLVANTWGSATLCPGDEIALSVLEHHSNLVPWQLLAARSGCVLRFATLGPGGAPPGVDEWRAAITPRTRLVATAAVSNVLGSSAPVAQLAEMCRSVGAKLLLDACQSVPHVPTDVSSLGADFLVASGHKMCGPTGIGFLWARPEILAAMPPWQGGGEMIATVGLESSSFAEPPARFEAGTPAIAEAIGLGAACDYLSSLGMRNVAAWEAEMGGYLYDTLSSRVPGISIYGPVPGGLKGGHGVRSALAAFNVKGLHATDVSTLLDASGVAVRSGHHCCQPLHAALGVGASARASLYVYNTKAEVDAAADALAEVCSFLRDAGAASEPL